MNQQSTNMITLTTNSMGNQSAQSSLISGISSGVRKRSWTSCWILYDLIADMTSDRTTFQSTSKTKAVNFGVLFVVQDSIFQNSQLQYANYFHEQNFIQERIKDK